MQGTEDPLLMHAELLGSALWEQEWKFGGEPSGCLLRLLLFDVEHYLRSSTCMYVFCCTEDFCILAATRLWSELILSSRILLYIYNTISMSSIYRNIIGLVSRLSIKRLWEFCRAEMWCDRLSCFRFRRSPSATADPYLRFRSVCWIFRQWNQNTFLAYHGIEVTKHAFMSWLEQRP